MPAHTVQLCVDVWRQVKSSSIEVSASSSQLLQTSARVQPPQPVQSARQVWLPVPLHTVQLWVEVWRHVKSSSATVSASSSQLLQTSAWMQSPQLQPVTQVRVPDVMQEVVQDTVDPSTHVKPSSVVVSQSSSRPLQASLVLAMHEPHAQLPLHVRVPVHDPTVHACVCAGVQGYPLSTVPSQSSSAPLHVSGVVTTHEPHVQLVPHVLVPPHVPVAPVRVHASVEPRMHENVSSIDVSQSSSVPSQVSEVVAAHVP